MRHVGRLARSGLPQCGCWSWAAVPLVDIHHEPECVGIGHSGDLLVRHGVHVGFLGPPHSPPNVRTHPAAQPRIGMGEVSLEFEGVAEFEGVESKRGGTRGTSLR